MKKTEKLLSIKRTLSELHHRATIVFCSSDGVETPYRTTDPKQNYTISFSIKYANSNKHIKVSEVSKIPDCIYPNSNGLKYKNAEIMIDNYVYQISPDPKSSLFDSRWNKVMGREHVFSIEICSINPSIDKTKGRPPTDYEDFCPNCYEILPVIKDYKKCPGCLSDVVKTDKTLKSNVWLGYG